MLLELSEIAFKLHEKFSPFDGEMESFIMKSGGASVDEIADLENKLNVKLHNKFKGFVLKYNLNDFSLGSFVFGNGGSYLEKIFELNNENDLTQWWGTGKRPDNFLLVTYNDPYSILLDMKNGKVYAMTSESDLNNIECISSDFCLFCRGVGTLFLNNQKTRPGNLERFVGSKNDAFWSSL